jgi:uncharacterized repeat protein (TIGR03847 family)
MTSRILLFDPVERFVAGTVGQPGERTFFIQARTGSRIISVSLEKAQVQALAERLIHMVREIKQSDTTISVAKLVRDDGPLETPIEEEFRVGVIGLAFDSARELIQVDLQAVAENGAEEPDFIDVDDLSSDQDILKSSHYAFRGRTI